MLATPHMVAGGAVGKLARRPWIAFPLALGLHFVLDAVPHIDAHGLFGSPQGYTTLEVISATIDSLLGVGLIVLLVRKRPGYRVIYWSAFFGILPDILSHVPPMAYWFWTWPSLQWFNTFHHFVQRNLPLSQWPLAFGTQIILLAVAIWIIRAPGRASTNRRNV